MHLEYDVYKAITRDRLEQLSKDSHSGKRCTRNVRRSMRKYFEFIQVNKTK